MTQFEKCDYSADVIHPQDIAVEQITGLYEIHVCLGPCRFFPCRWIMIWIGLDHGRWSVLGLKRMVIGLIWPARIGSSSKNGSELRLAWIMTAQEYKIGLWMWNKGTNTVVKQVNSRSFNPKTILLTRIDRSNIILWNNFFQSAFLIKYGVKWIY